MTSLEVAKCPATDRFGSGGQAAALGVGEPQATRPELLAEHAVLFLEIVDDVPLLLIDPPGDGDDEKLEHLRPWRHSGRAYQMLDGAVEAAR